MDAAVAQQSSPRLEGKTSTRLTHLRAAAARRRQLWLLLQGPAPCWQEKQRPAPVRPPEGKWARRRPGAWAHRQPAPPRWTQTSHSQRLLHSPGHRDSSHKTCLQAPNGLQQQTQAQQHVGQQQRKAFIKGISPAAGKAELEALLAPCGTVVDFSMPEDRSSQPPRHRVSPDWLQGVFQQPPFALHD